MAGRRKRVVRGGETRDLRPDWRPLLDFAPDEIPEFMWMYRVELEDGTVVEAYKHVATRRYLYLDVDGRAYVSVGRVSYEEADPIALLLEVLEADASGLGIVGQNEWDDGEKIAWARSATRHRISHRRTRFAIERAGVCFENGTGRKGEPLLYFFGDDEAGHPLEIVGVEQEDRCLVVILSMSLRLRFEAGHKEALRWRKSA
jgi:hypothetical protein